jgi:hypothetical protein
MRFGNWTLGIGALLTSLAFGCVDFSLPAVEDAGSDGQRKTDTGNGDADANSETNTDSNGDAGGDADENNNSGADGDVVADNDAEGDTDDTTDNAGPKKCMLIGASPGEENADWDDYIIPKLRDWGYEVDRKHTRAEILKYTDKDFAPYDFIFLSETLDSRIPGMDKLRSIPLPMLNSDGWGAKPSVFAFGEKQGMLEKLVSVEFLDAAEDHPLGAGYAPGTVVEFGSKGKRTCFSVWGTPTVDAVPIAAVDGESEKLMIYGIEKGTLNAAGDAIQHRVATIGIHAWCYDNLTKAGEDVFKAGIEWVLGEQ